MHLGVFTEFELPRRITFGTLGVAEIFLLGRTGATSAAGPPKPDLRQLLSGAKGVAFRLNAIASGSVTMVELVLPTFREATFSVSISDPNFVECCFAYALASARNHGRVLGFEEADKLPNEVYFRWYSDTIMRSDDLLQLVQMKAQCRNTGFDVHGSMVQALALRYLRWLTLAIDNNSTVQG